MQCEVQVKVRQDKGATFAWSPTTP